MLGKKYQDPIIGLSGVIISPQKIEFWEATDEYTSRLHNRFVFELQNDQWVTKRLYP